MPKRKVNYLPLLLLPLAMVICLTLWVVDGWPLPWQLIESDNAVFDARDFDFTSHIATPSRCVEYIPGELLTPEEFAARDDIRIGPVPLDTDVYTMRIRFLVPDGIQYGVAGYSVNYASSLYINGLWLFDEGKPGLTRDDEQSSEAYRIFSAEPHDGVIEILAQTSSFANIDTATGMNWGIGDYETLRVQVARSFSFDVVVMSFYFIIALIALLLSFMLPGYRANLWLALLALVWVIRTGLKNQKTLLTFFPDHTWPFVYKVEIMTTFCTILLFVLIMHSIFPKCLPKWLRVGMIGGNIAALGYVVVMPWYTFFGHSVFTNPIVYWALALLCLFVIVPMRRRKEPLTLAQWVQLAGTVLVLLAFVWDRGYFEFSLFTFTLTQPMMLVFSIFMLVSTMLATMQKTVAREVELTHMVESQEQELTNARVSIMLSQIQPHFLYNSLTAIKNLCRREPGEAIDALDAFAEYLRGNMDSLAEKDCIPFDREVEHTRNYLALEEKRFRQTLHVEYDLRCRDFLLPSLTMQPLVENAVRHGVTKKPGGGQISIRSEESPSAWIITIEDDGTGFDTASLPDGSVSPDASRSHIGISNVRKRLAAMCGGSLVVESAPGKGTVATITIPKEEGDI